MKKFFAKIVCFLMLIAITVSAAACGGSWSPSDVTLKDWGAIVSNDGFIAETENYIYYINGIAVTSGDNTFGAPIKGSLMAAKKSDLTDTCIVVPKIFGASDYSAGLYLDGDYVYYGTPSTDKDSSGKTATYQLEFARTKLDGTDTKSFIKVPSLDIEYRFIKDGNDVVIVYYDTDDEALYAYNTADGTTVTIAEKSQEVEGESLNAYIFGKDFVAFTTTVYAEAYNEAAAESDSEYSRPTENYNRVYVFVPGNGKTDEGVYGKKVLDGKADVNFAKTYSLTFFESGYMFYTETGVASGNEAQTFANNLDGFKNGAEPTLIANTDFCSKESAIIDLNTVYAVSDTSVIKTSLVAGYKNIQKTVAKIDGTVSLLSVSGDYLYFSDSDSKLTRIKVKNIDENVETDKVSQRVSENSVATSWYEPVIIGGKIFYCDNTVAGGSYVKYVPVDGSAVIKTEKNDDGEITLCYLDGATHIGKFTDEDKVTMAKSKISDISEKLSTGVIVFDTDDDGNVIVNEDGDPVVSVIDNARKSYDALGSLKGNVPEDSVKTLEKYEEALRINRLLYKLEGFDELTDVEKNAKETDFKKAEEAIEALRVSDEFDFAEIRNLMSKNANWYYQTAKTYFDTSND